MKIKNKIRLGFSLIFAIVILFGAVSVFFISQLSKDSKVILRNNYETLNYAREMRKVLDEESLPLSIPARQAFNNQLVKQEHNITERNEDVATAALRKSFNKLKTTDLPLADQQRAVQEARSYLRSIEQLNMQAIINKTDAIQLMVNRASLILGMIGCITFLALFSFSVNVSGVIADPLYALEDGLKEISNGNYEYSLNLGVSDEFSRVALGFNRMAHRLKETESEFLSLSLADRHRIETIIAQIHDALICVNEKHEILYMNDPAQKLLNIHQPKVMGKQADKLLAANEAFATIVKNEDSKNPFILKVNGRDISVILESKEISIPNIADFRNDELNIADKAAGKIYILRNIEEYTHA